MARRELGITPTELIRSLATRINRVVVRRICRLYPSGKMAGPVCIVLLSLLLQGCARPTVHEPVTLTLLDQEWTTRKFTEERSRKQLDSDSCFPSELLQLLLALLCKL